MEGINKMENYMIKAPPASHEVVITWLINAPQSMVFRTITDPMLIPKWWGPRRFTTRVIKMIVMPGGTWRYIQTDQEGKEYGFHGVYHDVVEPEHLVYTSEYEGLPGHVTLYTDHLTENDGKTTITTKAIFESIQVRDQMLRWGMEEGTSEMTHRLNELLATQNVEDERKEK
jgi:uncharacterized protein YndB with AHSA1/START domain